MSIYYQKYKVFLELNRTVNGQEENIDEEEQDKTPDEEDEHAIDDEEPNDYSMNDGDEDSTEGEEENTDEDDFEEPDDENNTEEDEHAIDDEEPNDYSMNDGDEDSTEEENEDDTDENTDNEDDTDEVSDEVKQMEEELFKSIPADQMSIKVTELKKQYLDVYNSISNILLRTNKITKTDSNMKVLEFVTTKLMELKDMVKFYMANTFDTKSFIENTVNYQQYLATLNTINKIFKEIQYKKEDK